VIAHLSVVSLVVVASLAGLSTTQSTGNVQTGSDFLALVQQARGAADEPTPSQLTLGLGTLPQDEAVILDRSDETTRDGAAPAEPMASPVPVDPDATPLAAPQTGGTSTGFGGRAAAPAPASGALVWPVPVGSISQYYHSGHLALDIAAPYGSQVVAAQGGTVTWAGWRNNGGGFVVSINHGNGMTTVYNHLGSIWVSPGQYVGAGQGIGGVGCTGICTGPHVHFEVIVNGVIDNPLRYF
jgi:murein DD-endopeptidase MepM/ murein hydrolase activator NlpD